jgi:hypothetical protein
MQWYLDRLHARRAQPIRSVAFLLRKQDDCLDPAHAQEWRQRLRAVRWAAPGGVMTNRESAHTEVIAPAVRGAALQPAPHRQSELPTAQATNRR